MQRQPIVSTVYSPVRFSLALAACALALGIAPRGGAETFTKPTAEELSMTSLPGYPGAPAVVLYREEVTKDDMHVVQHYERIKILTEEGREKYANVELRYASVNDLRNDVYEDKSEDGIVARTIHADGTVIPFSGKPYLKTIEKGPGIKVASKVFTLPDVQVGSIIEYRYDTRYNDHIYEAPQWLIQGDLYVRSAHYIWYPTQRDMIDSDQQLIRYITWVPILPHDVKLIHRDIPSSGVGQGPSQVYELNIKDVKPIVREDHMPPIANFSYRVLFNFTPYANGAEFWKAAGKRWSKHANSFMDGGSDLRAATNSAVAGATSDQDKLARIYAAVMAIENTDYTREHERREDKAAGLGEVKNAGDVLTHKRGDSTELAELFVAMARSAGLDANLMLVPDRSRQLFLPEWLYMGQFDDAIAVVKLDGKDKFFDPGSRYCAFGSLAWQHTLVEGLRQVDGGTGFQQTPMEQYNANRTSRVANLQMAENAEITGKIDLTFLGAPALHWRQMALRGDEESLHHSLEKHLESMLPKTLDVKVTSVDNLDDYGKPLLVHYSAKGTVATPAGKRLVVPADLFTKGDVATFPHEKRELAVYFSYPQYVADALRINLPPTVSVEAVPSAAKLTYGDQAVYTLNVQSAPTSVTTRRAFAMNSVLFPSTDYGALRTFYSQLESSDQDSVVLKASANGPAPATTASTAPAQ